MKHYHPIVLLLISILFNACEKNYTMLTEIRPDGSCFRQLEVITRDSAFLTGDTTQNPFPFRLTPEWQIRIYHSSSTTSQPWPLSHWCSPDSVLVTASRDFSSVEVMNQEFRFDHSAWKNIKPESTFKKSFRWFYTHYSFTETYTQLPSQDIPIPLGKYMTPEEQIEWFQGNESNYQGMSGQEIYDYLSNIEGKATDWSNHNLFMLKYAAIQEFFGTKANNPFADCLLPVRDSIFNTIKNNPDYPDNNLITILDQYFKTDYFSLQYKQQQQVFDSIYDQKIAILNLFEPQFKYQLHLPGRIISTNASHYENEKLIWKLNAYRFLPADYTLTARSEKTNWWAIIVTLLFVGGLIYKWKKK